MGANQSHFLRRCDFYNRIVVQASFRPKDGGQVGGEVLLKIKGLCDNL